MRVRVINRRKNSMELSSSHDNIFSEVSSIAAPRGIPADIASISGAQVLRPEVFRLAGKRRSANATPAHMRGVSCFGAGSEIITQSGVKSASKLKVGDKVLTRDNGFQRILWVGPVQSEAAIPMTVEIASDAVTAGKPEKTVRIAARQSVLLTCPEIQSQFGSAEVLARAGDLLHLDGFTASETAEASVAILTEHHEILNISGLWMDSLIPDSDTLSALPATEKQAIKGLLPSLSDLPVERSYPSARILLRSEFARQFTR